MYSNINADIPQAKSTIKIDGNTALEFAVAPNPAISSEQLEIIYNLSAMGCNLIPIPYGEKGFRRVSWGYYSWGRIARSFNAWHLHKADAERAFAGFCNIAVIAGHTSNNLVVIDIDHPNTFNLAVFGCIRMFGHVFAVKTRRGGHIYIFCTDDSIPSQKHTQNNIEIQSDGCYVVGMGSVFIDSDGKEHRYTAHERNTGIPTATPEQIQAYIKHVTPSVKVTRDKRHTEINKQSNKTTADKQRYDEKTRDYFQNGHLIPPDTERHNRMVSACRVMLAYGDDPTYIYNKLYPIASASGLEHKEIHASLTSTINKFDPSKMRDSKQFVGKSTHALAREFLEGYNWQKPCTTSTKAVMEACITMSKREFRKKRFRVAIREIAELARMGKSTANRHLKMLQDIGVLNLYTDKVTGTGHATWNREKLIELTRPFGLVAFADASRAGVFYSDIEKSVENGTVVRSTTLEEIVTVPISTTFTKEQWDTLQERTALGRKTLPVWLWLMEQKEACNMRDIANKTGLSYQSARYHIQKLIECKLARKDGKLYIGTINDIQLLEMLRDGKQAEQKRVTRHRNEQFHKRVSMILKARKTRDIHYIDPVNIAHPEQPQTPENDAISNDEQYEYDLCKSIIEDFGQDVEIAIGIYDPKKSTQTDN